MAVPSAITDLNVTAASNSPAGSDSIGNTLDDYLRAIQAIVRREQAQGANVASAATTNIGATTDGVYLHITGTTTITSFGTVAAGISRVVVFDGALILTHNATSLILPGAANITTVAGDVAEFVSEGSGNWRCEWYQRSANAPGAVSSVSSSATGTTQAQGDNSTKIATTAYADRVGSTLTSKLNPITASVASNAMTLTINPQVIDFRSSTLGSGTINSRTVSAAISTVISSGSTAGSVSGQPSRIAVLAIDNAGTVEVAWCNATGANNLDEGTLISTTAEGGAGAADSGNVIYSTTARSSVPFRIVGYVDSTQATAGTWATAPSTIQGAGGLTSGNRPTQLFQQPAQATTSGTAINFTGVPAWVKRITLCFSGVSTNGLTGWYVQIGSGSYDTSGYLGGSYVSTTSALETAGFAGGQAASAAAIHHGTMTLTLLNPATNIWTAQCALFRTDTAQTNFSMGARTLAGTLTQFRMITGNGTDTFDAGSVGVLWE